MYLQPLNVSQEYLDDIRENLEAWACRSDSFTLTQFLHEHGLGFPYFKRCTLTCPFLDNAFEVVKAKLHSKWLELALTAKEIPRHKASVLMRYIRLYDSHGLLEEREAKKEVEYAKERAKIEYEVEQFKNEQLQEPFKAMYQKNAVKRKQNE